MKTDAAIDIVLGDRYRLLRRLRLSPAGPVWEALDLVRGGPVDICLVQGLPYKNPECRARLLHAIESLRWPSFAHRGAPWLLGYGDQSEILFVVMDAARGESVRERLDRSGGFEWRDAARIVATIASALDAAGRLGVPHEGITLRSVLLADGGAKVLDVGLTPAVWA